MTQSFYTLAFGAIEPDENLTTDFTDSADL